MATLKKYQLISLLGLFTEIFVEGQKESVFVRFEGGSRTPRRKNGTFQTDDPKLQKAIEESPGYGKTYKLIGESNTPEPLPPTVEEEIVEEPESIVIPTGEGIVKEVQKEAEEVEYSKDDKAVTETPEPIEANDANDDMGNVKARMVDGKSDQAITGITTAQAAKQWLRENFDDVSHRDVLNIEAVNKVAKEKGVIFPDWQPLN